MIALGVLVLLVLIATLVTATAFFVWRRWRAWRQFLAIAALTAALSPVFLMTLTGDVSNWFPRSWWSRDDYAMKSEVVFACVAAALLCALVSAALIVAAFTWWRTGRSNGGRAAPG